MSPGPRPAAFGGVQFDVLDWSDSVRRVIDKERPLNRTGASLRDRGTESRTTRCSIEFFDRQPVTGENAASALDFYERFKLFVSVGYSGRTRTFVHPLTGGYPAKVEDLEIAGSAGSPNVLAVTCTFVEDATEPSPFAAAGSRRPQAAGIHDARLQANTTESALGALGIDTSFLDDVNSTLDRWRDPDISSDIAQDLGRLTRTIENVRETGALATTPGSYAAWVATERLLYRLRLAAQAVRSSDPQIKEVEVFESMPLRQFVATVLGSDDPQDTYDRIVALNKLRDPGYLQAGLILRVPSTVDPDSDYISGPAR